MKRRIVHSQAAYSIAVREMVLGDLNLSLTIRRSPIVNEGLCLTQLVRHSQTESDFVTCDRILLAIIERVISLSRKIGTSLFSLTFDLDSIGSHCTMFPRLIRRSTPIVPL